MQKNERQIGCKPPKKKKKKKKKGPSPSTSAPKNQQTSKLKLVLLARMTEQLKLVGIKHMQHADMCASSIIDSDINSSDIRQEDCKLDQIASECLNDDIDGLPTH